MDDMVGRDAVRIMVASEKNRVAEHFGHCSVFNIFEVESGRVIHCGFVPNPGHRPDFLPDYLCKLGANVIIAGSMGSRAMDALARNGVEVLTGATGSARAAVERYAEGASAPPARREERRDERGGGDVIS
ncbi:NifB/NifX family molybdenum-iron cluster-binding protein [Methanomassiliicoccus luminyensis]|uniref:NifB/NifX family molybdenum-iron cluster-binding protein n=1 Tax=Methanomassiliicoccus luminyensis TaxID=1080712 RepID=UPI00035C7F34|nr:NifB/NifX family molybdenum-iron cluster-binding protein [Methanomassiliicoccus luminyensis]